MSRISKNSNYIIVLSIISVIGLQGCDKVSTLVEYFSPKKEAAQQAPRAQQGKASPAQVKKAPKKTAKAKANTLIQVGDWELSVEEYRKRLEALKEVLPQYDPTNKEQNKAIIDEVVNQQLLAQAARKQGIANKEEVKLAVEEFENTILVRELITTTLADIKVTEVEAKAFYDQNEQEFVAPAQWHLREIVVETEEEAKTILVDLYQGADFAETAKMKSTSGTKAQGGDLGLVSMQEFTFAKMAEVVFTLEKGEISRSFQGPDGFYIVRVEDKQGGAKQEFDEVKKEIIDGLTSIKQQQTVLSLVDKLRREIKVNINMQLLEE